MSWHASEQSLELNDYYYDYFNNPIFFQFTCCHCGIAFAMAHGSTATVTNPLHLVATNSPGNDTRHPTAFRFISPFKSAAAERNDGCVHKLNAP